jgi:transcriptional pleiotropic regulator of transition state genes
MYVAATKKVDELGRIVLPKEIRDELEIKEGDALDICVDRDNIILRKPGKRCVICRTADNLTEINNNTICTACLNEIKGS